MSVPTRCLLDKVVARRILEGLLKLAEGRDLTEEELWAIDLLWRAKGQDIRLFVTGGTVNILRRLASLPRYAAVVAAFMGRIEEVQPTRYFQRWARRLREFGFTREDAHVLALASFGTGRSRDILGMHFVATYDQPLITQWSLQEDRIRERLEVMRRELQPPYDRVALPQVLRPEEIISWDEGV
jgi:hypothetical protein